MATVLGCLIGLAIGIVIGQALEDSRDRSESSSASTPSDESAVAAAVDFAAALAAVEQGIDNYREGVRARAAEQWANEAAALAVRTFDFVQETYGPLSDLTYLPIKYKVLENTGGKARIQLWGATLAFTDEGELADQTWTIGTVDLTWNERWEVAGQESAAGPTPEELREDGAGDALNGFSEFGVGSEP